MSYTLRPFHNQFDWDQFVKNAYNGNIFHQIKFLKYHQEKFQNKECFYFFEDEKGNATGLLSYLEHIENGEKTLKSPYGASYGGIVSKKFHYDHNRKLIDSLISFLKANDFSKCRLTLPISCSAAMNETMIFNYLEAGFKVINSDISSVVDLTQQCDTPHIFNSKMRNKMNYATKQKVRCVEKASIDDFYFLMKKTFDDKHGVEPTHTKEEWEYLCTTLPEYFWHNVAYIEDTPVAGLGNVVINDNMTSCFYLCQDLNQIKTRALTKLIMKSMVSAFKSGYRFYDMGTSSINMKARANIFEFKESFGSFGNFRYTLEWQANPI
tara:strand:+ start:975 stop:1943 length:969 start_codon:yes stop_codon:yes gene_type:complete